VAGNEALRRAGPRAVVALALLLGGLSAGYAWVVARHLRDDARDTSRLLGRVFAGLNDPRADAATNALLDLAAQVRTLGVPIAVTDTAGPPRRMHPPRRRRTAPRCGAGSPPSTA